MNPLIARSICLLFPVLSVVGCDQRWSAKAISESRERANIIISALEAHRNLRGKYPETLAELTPRFLDSLPQPTAGQDPWIYGTDTEGRGFKLCFEGPEDEDPSYVYDSRLRDWIIDTK